MINRPKRLKSKEKTCVLNEDLIEYPEGTTIQLVLSIKMEMFILKYHLKYLLMK